jgi:TatD DNase family protein
MKLTENVGYTIRGNRYLNVTNRCTLRCAFCPKFNGDWAVKGHDLRMRREPSAAELVAAAGNPAEFQEIVFCGMGEPTLRLKPLLEAAERVKGRGGRVRVNTDGLANLVHGRDVTPEFRGRVDALSVSLNAQDAALYEKHCRPKVAGAYAAMLDFARRALDHVPEVYLSAIDGLEGVDIEACRKIAESLGVRFKRRVLDEVG